MTEAQDLASPSPKIGFVVDSGTPSSIHTVEAQAKEALARGIPPAQTVYATDTAQPAVPVVRVATAPVAKAPTSKASYPLQQQNKRYIPQQVTPLVSQPPSPTQPAAQFWPNCSEADFELGRVIGTGSFGRVRLAVHKASGAVCAVKTISKSACVKRGQVRQG